MGRYQSPLVKHDLSRLEDSEGRQIALASLKNCVKNLEPEFLASFLDQIAEAHQNVSRPRPFVISLYEDLARVHKTLLVPYIPRIMEALISALSESGSSLHVHESCGKVVASLAKHSIDTGRLAHQAKDVLRLLCEPLLCVLVGKFEPVSAGAAVSLTALVESENWIHAPRELVNEVCFRVVAALSGKFPTVAHAQLAISVARVNREMMESLGMELLVSGRDILSSATSWNLRVAAAQLLNSALGLVEGISISEVASVIEVLERHRLDRMPKVRSAVGEALKTARACCTTSKMIFPVGDSRQRVDPGFGSVLMPEFRSRKDLRAKSHPSVVSRNQRLRKTTGGMRPAAPPEESLGVEFVVVEDPQPNSRRKRDGAPRVRHTISAEPGGYVIQEWIKVDDRFPGCEVLAGIDEGEEYFESHDLYSAMSPGERQVVIFDEDHATTTRLIEETELPTIPEEPVGEASGAPVVMSSCSMSSTLETQELVLESSGEDDWSVRDNPIAAKSEESPVQNANTSMNQREAEDSQKETAAAEGVLEASEASCEMKPGSDESSLDSVASIDGSCNKASVSEELLDGSFSKTSVSQELLDGSFSKMIEGEELLDGSFGKTSSMSEELLEGSFSKMIESEELLDGSFSKMNASEELVDAFRRTWEVLESSEEHLELVEASASPSPPDLLVKAISSSFSEEELLVEITESPPPPPPSIQTSSSELELQASFSCVQQTFSRELEVAARKKSLWSTIRRSVEKVLAGSFCAALLLPATIALIKCLEQSSINSMDLVPT